MMTKKTTQGLRSYEMRRLPGSSDQFTSLKDQKLRNFAGLIRYLWNKEILRFFVVGAINTLFSYIVYALLVVIGFHYTLATLISTVLGVVFNFFTTGRIVFRSLDRRRFFCFVLVYTFTYFVNILLLRWLVDELAMDKLIAGALVTLPVALLSYFLNSKWTFHVVENDKENTNEVVSNGGAD